MSNETIQMTSADLTRVCGGTATAADLKAAGTEKRMTAFLGCVDSAKDKLDATMRATEAKTYNGTIAAQNRVAMDYQHALAVCGAAFPLK